MRRWFLSYHSPDQALAERLKAALERKGTDATIFFAPSSLRVATAVRFRIGTGWGLTGVDP
jgi:Xaa-Pro aminopeptidase